MKIKSFEQIQLEKEQKEKSKQVMDAIKQALDAKLPFKGFNIDSIIREVVSKTT